MDRDHPAESRGIARLPCGAAKRCGREVARKARRLLFGLSVQGARRLLPSTFQQAPPGASKPLPPSVNSLERL